MANKCPHCKSEKIELLSEKNNHSNSARGAAGVAAVGLAIVGACVGGPIGAAAGGTIGTMVSNGLSNIATDYHGKRRWKCKSCNRQWSEDY